MYKLKITSIIVSFNGEQWIKKCISSLINSTLKNDIIVIDNGSQDKTVDIIRDWFPEVEIIESKLNLGFGKANNIGIENALNNNSEYLFLLNQDAWVEPNTIEKLIKTHKKFPEYGILSPIHKSGANNLDKNFMNYLSERFTPGLISDSILKESISEVYETKFVNAAMWLLPSTTFYKIGTFLPIFNHYGEDDNFLDRCRYHNLKIGIVPTAFGVHDRPQAEVNPKLFLKSKFQNYVYSHLLVIALNPNRRFRKKLTPFLITILKGFYRKPLSTIKILFSFSSKLQTIKKQYIYSKIEKKF